MSRDITNNTTNYQEKRPSTKLGLAAYFATQTVKFTVIALGTLCFPATAIAMGVKSLCCNYNSNLDQSIILRSALASAVLPLPLIGSPLFYRLSYNNSLPGTELHLGEFEGPMERLEYIFLAIPFMSSLISSINIISSLKQLFKYCLGDH